MKSHITRLLFALGGLFVFSPAFAASVATEKLYGLCPREPDLLPVPALGGEHYALGTTVIETDEAEIVEDGISTLRGDVEVTRDQQAMRADLVTYDQPQDIVDLREHVNYWAPELFWSGQLGQVFLADEKARLEDGKYPGHGWAHDLTHERTKKLSRLKKLDYTTCDGEFPDWKLVARVLKLDHEEERGEAKDVTIRVRDVPVLYFPYLSFPLSTERKSGFLAPVIGFRTKTGADLTTPYYWNMAPNHDLTFNPRIMSYRGVMLGAEYRYLLPTGKGDLGLQYLPSDSTLNGQDRSLVTFTHQQSFPVQHISTYFTFNEVSDKTYFEDFGSTLAVSSTSFLEHRADVTYSGSFGSGNGWSLLGRLQGYQTVDSSLPAASRPYERLPQFSLSATMPNIYPNLYLQFLADTTYFDKEASPTGERLDLKPVLGLSLRTPSAFLLPKLSLRHTSYFLNDNNVGGNQINRTVPIVSLDSGLFLERDLTLGGKSYLQTLEPRAFYLYIPRAKQDDIPIFDTARYDLSFPQLFREDRFTGPDRIGEANQITLGLTSRFNSSETGLERLRASLGEVFYFDDRDVTLPGTPVATDPVSEIVGELGSQFSHDWHARTNFIWDPNSGTTEKATFGIRYWPNPETIVNAEYRLIKNLGGVANSFVLANTGGVVTSTTNIEQTDVSVHWPLTPNWGIVGRWNFSLDAMETLEAVGGIEYNESVEKPVYETALVQLRIV